MPSSPESNPAGGARSLERWNSRLHYYSGLYFLFFVWLFAVTGLLLNHGMWGAAGMSGRRTTTKSEHAVIAPKAGTPLAEARHYMRQLDLEGEVQWLGTTADAARFVFRVTRPGRQAEVRVDRKTSTALVERTSGNALGVARALHLFTGVRMNDARNDRDWIVTKVWILAMDAVAAGLLAMVATGFGIWWRSGTDRRSGLIALGTGVLCCAGFVFGLAAIA